MSLSFLKKAKDLQPTTSLKFLLHKHLSGPDPARALSRIHASELTREEGFCPRYYALHDVLEKKPKDKWLTTSENVTFRMGRRLQDDVVNDFADMGKAISHWRCRACNRLHEFCLRPIKCEKCGCKTFDPEEVRFTSSKTGASSGVDMLVALGKPKLTAVELKTMDKDQFKALEAPLAEHRLRTNLYLRILAECDHPWASMVDATEARVFYVSKGGYGCASPELKGWGLTDKFSPFKEFVIKRADKETHDISRRAQAVTWFRAGKVGMPCGICATAMSKRAISCSMKGPCFSGDHPPQFNWKEGK